MTSELYTDASYKNGIAGWGFVLDLGSHLVEGSGLADRRSINRAELEAVVQGLRRLPDGSDVSVFTDSIYVVCGSRHPNRYQGEFWAEFFLAKRRLKLRVVKVQTHQLHTRAHHLAREIVIK